MRRLGLRSRILLALLFTSAATLVAAGLALVSPLQDRLAEQARESMRSTALASRAALERELRVEQPVGSVTFEVAELIDTLARRTGARVVLFDAIPERRYDTGITSDRADDVFAVLAEDRLVTEPTDDLERLAVPLRLPRTQPPAWVLALRRPSTGSEAVDTVRDALVVAALAGLVVALLLGLALSATLSRRLGRLRRAALRLAREGTDAPAPRDDELDEVGDLARALGAMQDALRRQEQARRAFVATASHELRTPLTSLQGNLELLAEDLDEGRVDLADAREQLRASQGELRRLGNLATELLDLSRLDAGVELRREPVELIELCRAVAAEFELRAGELGVRIEVAEPPGPVWASGDPGAVARVVRILLDNALRFSPRGEAVEVVPAYHGDRATIDVADRGPGVPPDERQAIFERFRRGTRTGGEGGFGLGLAIGRELARRLDGELAIATDGKPGARFVLTLPIELPRGSEQAAAALERAARPLT